MCQIFSENYTPENKVIICNEGGTRCFQGDTQVVTDLGLIPISEIRPGIKVKSKTGFNTVTDVHKTANTKRSIRITLKNGQKIECTEDHKFFFEGAWTEIKDILSLMDGSLETNSKI